MQSKTLGMTPPDRNKLDGDPERFKDRCIVGMIDGQLRSVYLKKLIYRSFGREIDGKGSEEFESELCIVGNTTTTRAEDSLRFSKLSISLAGLEEWRRGELLKTDKRWIYGVPPAGNANYAWIEHFISHLSPTGLAGFVLANGSMSSNQSGEGEIRKAIIEADLVDCMVALPGQLFYATQIPVCLWFLAKYKKNGRFRDRRGETLFIDARKLGVLTSRVQRELTDSDVQRIAGSYHAWRGDKGAAAYDDVPGFCKAVRLEDIRAHG